MRDADLPDADTGGRHLEGDRPGGLRGVFDLLQLQQVFGTHRLAGGHPPGLQALEEGVRDVERAAHEEVALFLVEVTSHQGEDVTGSRGGGVGIRLEHRLLGPFVDGGKPRRGVGHALRRDAVNAHPVLLAEVFFVDGVANVARQAFVDGAIDFEPVFAPGERFDELVPLFENRLVLGRRAVVIDFRRPLVETYCEASSSADLNFSSLTVEST